MIRLYPNEVFKPVSIDYPLRFNYAVSNRGRLISYTDRIENGTLLKGGRTQGYRMLRYKMVRKGRQVNKALFIYKLVAELFVPKESEDQTHVIHLDHSRDNDVAGNLRWATFAQVLAHRRSNPNVQGIGQKVVAYKRKADGRKLTVTQVMRLKKLLADPNRKTRLKILAKQFGISEMQVCRIKRGENWGHVGVTGAELSYG